MESEGILIPEEKSEPSSPSRPHSAVAFVSQLIRGNKRTTFGFAILAVLLAMALGGPLISPYNPLQQDLTSTYLLPIWAGGTLAHPFGTDSLGRDILSRLLYGFQIAAYIGLISAFFVALIGTPIGLVSGFFRGKLDGVVMRIVDMWMSIPPVLLSIALILILGNSINNVILAIVLVDWTRFARVVRSEVFNIREKDFITAAESVGYGKLKIIKSEVLPNALPIITVLVTLEISIAIYVEVLLSFVGIGIPTNVVSWGAMIAEGLPYLEVDPWPLLITLVVVALVIVGLNLFGDGIREQIDPRLQTIK
jgi:peptide/nickel transport system permease protein